MRMGVILLMCIALAGAFGNRQSAAGESMNPPWTSPCALGDAVTVLVHGMTWDDASPDMTWGRPIKAGSGVISWDGMIGVLERRGLRYGGRIRSVGSSAQLPKCLDRLGCIGDPTAADFFVLEFSSAAKVDGLAYKALELANCLKELRAFTGRRKVCIVAYSAGGLVARTYLQSALPGVKYNDDVERLITVATPHLGSQLATVAKSLGDLLGTKASSLMPEAELVRNLNSSLELPPDVCFASIVVRGIAAGVDGEPTAYWHLIDRPLVERLPVDFRRGGDQVIHVCSQNLRLAKCCRSYEAKAAMGVQSILVRVADPTPDDRHPLETTVHEVVTRDAAVQEWIVFLLAQDTLFWSTMPLHRIRSWKDRQARITALGIVEEQALAIHRFSEVTDVDLTDAQCTAVKGDVWSYRFSGIATTKGFVVRLPVHRTQVSGTMELSFDRFGRIDRCEPANPNVKDIE